MSSRHESGRWGRRAAALVVASSFVLSACMEEDAQPIPPVFSETTVATVPATPAIDPTTTPTTVDVPEVNMSLLDGSTFIAIGSRGERVGNMQTSIEILGCYDLDVDSIFGVKTEAGVKSVQTAAGLPPTGVADTLTQQKIVEGLTTNVRNCWGNPTATTAAAKPQSDGSTPVTYAGVPSFTDKECPTGNVLQDAASNPIPASAARYPARSTVYTPQDSTTDPEIEGGMDDRKIKDGLWCHSLDDYLEGKFGLQGEGAYVALAMDPKAFPYGTVIRIPELEAKYGKVIICKVVDTGGAFNGRLDGIPKGTKRVDIMGRFYEDHLDFGDTPVTLAVVG